MLHVVPKLAGAVCACSADARLDLRRVEAIAGEGAMHLRYQVS